MSQVYLLVDVVSVNDDIPDWNTGAPGLDPQRSSIKPRSLRKWLQRDCTRHGRCDALAAVELINDALARALSRLSAATCNKRQLLPVGRLRRALVGLLNEYQDSSFRRFSTATTSLPSAPASRPVARRDFLEANSDGQASSFVSLATHSTCPSSAITTALFCH